MLEEDNRLFAVAEDSYKGDDPDIVIYMLLAFVEEEWGSAIREEASRIIFQAEDNDIAIDYLLDFIDYRNKEMSTQPLFYHLPTDDASLYNDKYSLPCTHTVLPKNIVEKLSLRHACRIGTWGRFRVLEGEFPVIPASKTISSEILLLIVHCNIHNSPARQNNLELALHSYQKLFEAEGIKKSIVISANEYSTAYDQTQAKNRHPNHEHWSPHYVVSIMKRLFTSFPNSIVLTHRYIGSLLLDNRLFFKMHFLIDIDNLTTMKRCFSDIYKYMKCR